MTDKQRLSNYELLRLLAGMAVVVLHFNFFPSGGGALDNASGETYYVLMIFEIIALPAVNIFLLLSGYFSCHSNTINTGRLIEILIQTIIFRFGFAIVSSIANHNWDAGRIISSLVPVNFFVILYIVLMILAPFINKLISSLKSDDFTRLVTIMFVIFSVYVTAVDVFQEISDRTWNGLSAIGLDGSMGGYTIVNFVLVYIIGAWIKKSDVTAKWRTSILLVVLVASIIALFVWKTFIPGSAWNYSNPILIIESVVIFTLFGKIKISNKVINNVARASFTCFLININILGFFGERFYAGRSTFLIVCVLFAETLAIYVLSYVIMLIWNLITQPIIKHTLNKLPKHIIG